MRFFRDDPTLVKVRYYFVPEGTPRASKQTPFRSRNWCRDADVPFEGLGEVYESPRTFVDGRPVGPIARPGDTICATPDQWANGLERPPAMPVVLDAFGVPVCCRNAPRLQFWLRPQEVEALPEGTPIVTWDQGPGAVGVIEDALPGWEAIKRSPGAVFQVNGPVPDVPPEIGSGYNAIPILPLTDDFTAVLCGEVLGGDGQPYFSVPFFGPDLDARLAVYAALVQSGVDPTQSALLVLTPGRHIWVITRKEGRTLWRVDGVSLLRTDVVGGGWAAGQLGLTNPTMASSTVSVGDVFHLCEVLVWEGALDLGQIEAVEDRLTSAYSVLGGPTDPIGTWYMGKLLSEEFEPLQVYLPPT